MKKIIVISTIAIAFIALGAYSLIKTLQANKQLIEIHKFKNKLSGQNNNNKILQNQLKFSNIELLKLKHDYATMAKSVAVLQENSKKLNDYNNVKNETYKPVGSFDQQIEEDNSRPQQTSSKPKKWIQIAHFSGSNQDTSNLSAESDSMGSLADGDTKPFKITSKNLRIKYGCTASKSEKIEDVTFWAWLMTYDSNVVGGDNESSNAYPYPFETEKINIKEDYLSDETQTVETQTNMLFFAVDFDSWSSPGDDVKWHIWVEEAR